MLLFYSKATNFELWPSCHFSTWVEGPTDLYIKAVAHTFDSYSSMLMRNPKAKWRRFSPLDSVNFVINIRPWNVKYRGSITKEHRLWSSDRKLGWILSLPSTRWTTLESFLPSLKLSLLIGYSPVNSSYFTGLLTGSITHCAQVTHRA